MEKLMVLRVMIKYLSVALMLLIPFTGYSAGIKKISKKGKFVIIDEGKSSGVKKGTKVCFYRGSKKIACGKVKKARSNDSQVKLSSKSIKKIKKSHRAEISSSSSKSGIAKSKKSSSNAGNSIHASWNPALMSHIKYNHLSFTPAAEEGATTLWESTGSNSTALFGFKFGFEMRSLGLDLGVRLRQYQTHVVDANYATTSDFDSHHVDQKIEGSSNGVMIDYLMYNSMGRSARLSYGVGLDIDMSTVTFSSVHKIDETPEFEDSLFTASSAATTISLRVPVRYDMAIDKKMGLKFGSDLIIPLSGAPTLALEIDKEDDQVKKLAGDPEEDFKTSLGHSSSFGLDLTMGAYIDL